MDQEYSMVKEWHAKVWFDENETIDQEYSMDIEWRTNVWLNEDVVATSLSK